MTIWQKTRQLFTISKQFNLKEAHKNIIGWIFVILNGPSLGGGDPGGVYEGGHPGCILGVAGGVSHSLFVVAIHLSILSDWMSLVILLEGRVWVCSSETLEKCLYQVLLCEKSGLDRFWSFSNATVLLTW